MNQKERLEIQRNARIWNNIESSRIPRYTQETRRLRKLKRDEQNAGAFSAAIDFLECRIVPPLFFIIGTPGVGKTSIAYAIAWEYLEDSLSVLYYQVEELLNELQSSMEDGKQYGNTWKRLRDCDLLILDDIDAHNPTKWRESQLDSLVDFRYRQQAPLIMTANKVDDLSERITDRIKEGRTVMITGHSWRGKAE